MAKSTVALQQRLQLRDSLDVNQAAEVQYFSSNVWGVHALHRGLALPIPLAGRALVFRDRLFNMVLRSRIATVLEKD